MLSILNPTLQPFSDFKSDDLQVATSILGREDDDAFD